MMHPLFASAALGLVAAWPASGLGWLLGKAADRLTDDPALRTAAWNRAVALPPALLGLMTGISLLPEEATTPVYSVVASTKAAATAGAVVNDATARIASNLNTVETAAALLILGAAGGLAVATVRQVIGRARLARIVRDARPAETDLALAIGAAARRLDTGHPEVRISDRIDQPLLAGLTRPVILLPRDLVERLPIERLVPICAHELGHLKRGDNWRLLFEHLVGGLFWMVPPFAVLRARAAAAREELCDALALTGATPEVRRGYAESLLAVLRAHAAPTLHPAFTGKGRKPTAMRLKAITDPHPAAGWGRKALLGATTALVVAATGATSMALAQQDRGGASVRSQLIATNENKSVTITADTVWMDRAETDGNALRLPGGQTATYVGDIEIRGRLGENAIILLNGSAAPAGFDPTRLERGAIKRLEVKSWQEQDRVMNSFNVVMNARP
ncbi:peptidase M56 [Caulobacter vibrioides]|uniref:Peptidase M56 n=1 Tax=Caulobacter vibrioides TaxID=155892 RepID=A0A290MWD3_CAUVI|nr:M56 family metallopeptidase [Caulobacter vibrioides]ATC34203.1 peptidase M56 [Caulobacter vibrioides]